MGTVEVPDEIEIRIRLLSDSSSYGCLVGPPESTGRPKTTEN